MSKAIARERYGVGRYRTDGRPISTDKGPKELAQIIEDTCSGKRYLRGRFLGKVSEARTLTPANFSYLFIAIMNMLIMI